MQETKIKTLGRTKTNEVPTEVPKQGGRPADRIKGAVRWGRIPDCHFAPEGDEEDTKLLQEEREQDI